MLDSLLMDKCRSQVLAWHARLTSPALTKDETVWHYTRGESLIPIIDSGTLFATQASCLNDATELRYASRLLKEYLLLEISSLGLEDSGAGFVGVMQIF
jgi:hypothetical protein